MLKVILKKVGQEPKIVEFDIDKDNGFEVSDKFKDVLGDSFAVDRMAIDKESGLYLYVPELAEGRNFNIRTNSPYAPVQTIIGDCLLTRYMNEEGWAKYGDMTENELELMKALVDMDDEKVMEHIEIARENLSEREKELLEEEAIVKQRMAQILRGLY